MKVDAEVYFWKYEKTNAVPLIRNNHLLQQHYLPENILQNLHRNGIDGCIASVPEPAEVETRFLAELAATHPEIRAVIGWIDLQGTKAIETIGKFETYESIRGYRINLLTENIPAAETMALLLEKSYCLDLSVGTGMDMSACLDWIGANPRQQFIIQGCGNPDSVLTLSDNWKNIMRELSMQPNVSCKISGLLEKADRKSWKPADFYPILDTLLEGFGPARLLYASNWPFLLLSGMYIQWKSLLEKFTENLIPDERDAIFGGNAERLYRL